MANPSLAEAVDRTTTHLRLTYSASELADLVRRIELATRALQRARSGNEHGGEIDRRVAFLAEAQAEYDWASAHVVSLANPGTTGIESGWIYRADDECVLVTAVEPDYLVVARGALGSDRAAHDPDTVLIRTSAIGQVAIEVVIDGGGSAIDPGEKSRVVVPWRAGRIQRVQLAADQVGDAVIDILRSAFGDAPGVGASITAAAKPTLTAASTYDDAALVGWDTSISRDDVLQFVVDSASSVERLTVALTVGL